MHFFPSSLFTLHSRGYKNRHHSTVVVAVVSVDNANSHSPVKHSVSGVRGSGTAPRNVIVDLCLPLSSFCASSILFSTLIPLHVLHFCVKLSFSLSAASSSDILHIVASYCGLKTLNHMDMLPAGVSSAGSMILIEMPMSARTRSRSRSSNSDTNQLACVWPTITKIVS